MNLNARSAKNAFMNLVQGIKKKQKKELYGSVLIAILLHEVLVHDFCESPRIRI